MIRRRQRETGGKERQQHSQPESVQRKSGSEFLLQGKLLLRDLLILTLPSSQCFGNGESVI